MASYPSLGLNSKGPNISQSYKYTAEFFEIPFTTPDVLYDGLVWPGLREFVNKFRSYAEGNTRILGGARPASRA